MFLHVDVKVSFRCCAVAIPPYQNLLPFRQSLHHYRTTNIAKLQPALPLMSDQSRLFTLPSLYAAAPSSLESAKTNSLPYVVFASGTLQNTTPHDQEKIRQI